MPVRRSSFTEECQDCGGPINPGEIHRGPTFADKHCPTLCWTCARTADKQRLQRELAAREKEEAPPPAPGKLF